MEVEQVGLPTEGTYNSPFSLLLKGKVLVVMRWKRKLPGSEWKIRMDNRVVTDL